MLGVLARWKVLAAAVAVSGGAVATGHAVAAGVVVMADPAPVAPVVSAPADPADPTVTSWVSAGTQYRADLTLRAAADGTVAPELGCARRGVLGANPLWVSGATQPTPVEPVAKPRCIEKAKKKTVRKARREVKIVVPHAQASKPKRMRRVQPPTTPTLEEPTTDPSIPPTTPTTTPTTPTTPTTTPANTGQQGGRGPRNGPTAAPDPVIGPKNVRFTQANIYTGLGTAQWNVDYQRVLATRPDFITLNEVPRRTDAQLAINGYQVYRSPKSAITRETPVLWRTDRWAAIGTGTEHLTTRRVKWGVRAVNWATLRHHETGRVVSIISAHPAPTRKFTAGLLPQFITRLAGLTNRLAAQGPVFVGGDLNVHYKTPSWPTGILSTAGLSATFDALGRPPAGTGDHGATIDYVLYQPSKARVDRGGTIELNSDHDAIWADFTLPD